MTFQRSNESTSSSSSSSSPFLTAGKRRRRDQTSSSWGSSVDCGFRKPLNPPLLAELGTPLTAPTTVAEQSCSTASVTSNLHIPPIVAPLPPLTTGSSSAAASVEVAAVAATGGGKASSSSISSSVGTPNSAHYILSPCRSDESRPLSPLTTDEEDDDDERGVFHNDTFADTSHERVLDLADLGGGWELLLDVEDDDEFGENASCRTQEVEFGYQETPPQPHKTRVVVEAAPELLDYEEYSVNQGFCDDGSVSLDDDDENGSASAISSVEAAPEAYLSDQHQRWLLEAEEEDMSQHQRWLLEAEDISAADVSSLEQDDYFGVNNHPRGYDRDDSDDLTVESQALPDLKEQLLSASLDDEECCPTLSTTRASSSVTGIATTTAADAKEGMDPFLAAVDELSLEENSIVCSSSSCFTEVSVSSHESDPSIEIPSSFRTKLGLPLRRVRTESRAVRPQKDGPNPPETVPEEGEGSSTTTEEEDESELPLARFRKSLKAVDTRFDSNVVDLAGVRTNFSPQRKGPPALTSPSISPASTFDEDDELPQPQIVRNDIPESNSNGEQVQPASKQFPVVSLTFVANPLRPHTIERVMNQSWSILQPGGTLFITHVIQRHQDPATADGEAKEEEKKNDFCPDLGTQPTVTSLGGRNLEPATDTVTCLGPYIPLHLQPHVVQLEEHQQNTVKQRKYEIQTLEILRRTADKTGGATFSPQHDLIQRWKGVKPLCQKVEDESNQQQPKEQQQESEPQQANEDPKPA